MRRPRRRASAHRCSTASRTRGLATEIKRRRRPTRAWDTLARMEAGWITPNHVAPLRWSPWYINQFEDQEAIAWVWPIIQDVCELPDPQLFPRFEYKWDSGDRAMLRRYVGGVRAPRRDDRDEQQCSGQRQYGARHRHQGCARRRRDNRIRHASAAAFQTGRGSFV
jgi:hypothetical protein